MAEELKPEDVTSAAAKAGNGVEVAPAVYQQLQDTNERIDEAMEAFRNLASMVRRTYNRTEQNAQMLMDNRRILRDNNRILREILKRKNI